MPISPDWDARDAIRRCARVGWQGEAWRIHKARYAAESHGGSLKVSGRYHRGGDLFAEDEVFAALYLTLSPEIALAELVRHVTPELLPTLNGYRLSRLRVELVDVLDARSPDLLELEIDDLCSDIDHDLTRELGGAVVEAGSEALLIPSATRMGNNLIVFPDNLQPGSFIQPLDYRQPRLYVERDVE